MLSLTFSSFCVDCTVPADRRGREKDPIRTTAKSVEASLYIFFQWFTFSSSHRVSSTLFFLLSSYLQHPPPPRYKSIVARFLFFAFSYFFFPLRGLFLYIPFMIYLFQQPSRELHLVKPNSLEKNWSKNLTSFDILLLKYLFLMFIFYFWQTMIFYCSTPHPPYLPPPLQQRPNL